MDGVRKRLTWFLEETKITRLSQLRPSLATTVLKTLRDAGRSDRTNVALPGRDTKDSDDAIQPLPAHVIPALRSWLATKPSLTPLFPPDRNSALMIRADLKAAGIPSDDYDFHGLRHCFVSQIVQSGASVKDAMELARHSDADLTFNRYAHSRMEELSKVVDKLPDLWEKCGKGDGFIHRS